MNNEIGFSTDETARARATELRTTAARLMAIANAIDKAVCTDTLWLSLASAERDQLASLTLAEAEYNGRRRRELFFKTALFGEPAWDMLLDLFIHEAHGKRVSITSVCRAAGVPPTTALRWLSLLEAEAMVERVPAVHDLRVQYVRLTEQAKLALTRWLHQRAAM